MIGEVKIILTNYRDRERPAIDDMSIQLGYLNEKIATLWINYKQYGRLEDLAKAIEALELGTSIAGVYVNPKMFLSSGALIYERFQRTGSMDDLDRAIVSTRNAVDATTNDDPLQPEVLGTLGTMLGARFEQTGSMDDINQAISMISDAANAIPYGDPNRFAYLCNLGLQLWRRFNWTGLIDDLNQAIRVASDAVDAAPSDSLERATSLNNLGSFLCRRFDHMGLMDDLDRAAIVIQKALDILPDSHPQRLSYLGNLGGLFSNRFIRTESMSDLNRAVSVTSDAVDAAPDNHPLKWKHLSNLSSCLSSRFEHTGSIDDLNRAVNAASDAVNRMPHHDHRERAACLSNLGSRLSELFSQTRSMDDLDRSISVSSDAVDAAPHDHPQRATLLRNLGDRLGQRFKQLNSTDDLNRQLSYYIASWDCINGPPSLRIRSAQMAAEILIQQQDWEKAYQLLHDATSLLPTMSPRSLNHTDTQAMLSSLFGLASLAAAVALQVGKTPGDALRLLELGRGVIASLLMDMRGDVTELQSKHPGLAEKFNHLRAELDSPAHNISVIIPDQLSSWELQIKRRREADGEFSKTIDEIRTQPGFSQFLQPPAVEDLLSASDRGPVIVLNVSSFRSDAFLVQSDTIQVINFPGITHRGLLKQMKDFPIMSDWLSSCLEWLWNTICRPCLDALGFTESVSDGNWPHVWWIPTGAFSPMPLHAAGIYEQASKETVLDRVISSYALSIKALLHGRKRSIQKSSQAASPDGSALIVAMQDTPGLGQDGHLHFANAEIDLLQGLCPKLQLTPSIPQRLKNDVLEQLPKCNLFHFAGHGRFDLKNPSQSCLLLEDWETHPLTMGAVRDSQLQNNPPFLAYLSACSTGVNMAVELFDEGIHLISAFQLAGFQHVVGTLWQVSDKHCVDVARILYETLQDQGMTDEAVSRGLHRAIRALRDGVIEEDTQERDAKLARRKPEAQRVVDFLWVPYVHFGV